LRAASAGGASSWIAPGQQARRSINNRWPKRPAAVPRPKRPGDSKERVAMATTAIVGEKVGMSQKWVDDKVVPVTVLRVEPMRIVQVKTPTRDGYSALQVTYGRRDA